MTIKEKEEKILEAFGLQVGDRIRRDESANPFYKIVESESSIWIINEKSGTKYDIGHFLTFYDWEKIKPLLKDKKCKDFDGCEGCPFSNTDCHHCSLVCSNEITNKDREGMTLEEIYIKVCDIVEKEREQVSKKIFGEEK